jgi:hypothetical protein
MNANNSIQRFFISFIYNVSSSEKIVAAIPVLDILHNIDRL